MRGSLILIACAAFATMVGLLWFARSSATNGEAPARPERHATTEDGRRGDGDLSARLDAVEARLRSLEDERMLRDRAPAAAGAAPGADAPVLTQEQFVERYGAAISVLIDDARHQQAWSPIPCSLRSAPHRRCPPAQSQLLLWRRHPASGVLHPSRKALAARAHRGWPFRPISHHATAVMTRVRRRSCFPDTA
jgi:hypothetical protein